MPSSNPVFGRGFGNAGNGQQYPGWGAAPAVRRADQYGAPAQHDPYAAPSPYAATTTRYMTMDDVVTKTGLSFLVTVLAAAADLGAARTGRLGPRAPGRARRPSCSAW